jgi:uncharacterized repeat protein (TIGR01451 family)
MRSSKAILAALAVGVLVASTIVVAGANITATGGAVINLATPPPSVKLNALENATKVNTFDEAQGKTLTAAIAVDGVNPGTYSTFPSGTAKIPVGTVVDSHLIHSDIPSRNYTSRRIGTVTFADDILGVVASTAKLAASDSLGATGTLYAGTTQWRGLESSENGWATGGDKYTISADRRTLSFDIQTLVMDEIRVITKHKTTLVTSITDSPDPVTAGNDVLYTLTVTNVGTTAVANAHVVDTLPAGATLVTGSAPGGCSGTGPVDCTLGALAVGASAQATLVVTSPATVPVGGTITNSAAATPGVNAPATQVTTVEAPTDGVTKGYVLPGGSLTIPGDNPATLSLPETGNGAPVVITQGEGTFCNGPCEGPFTDIAPFEGYSDPNNPISLELTYNFPDSATSLTDAATAYGATIYKNVDPDNPGLGSTVPFCTTTGAGIAVPAPCVDGRTITQVSPNSFEVTFTILYLSGDPKFARR